MLFVWCTDALNNFDGGYRTVRGANATAVIFVTFPQPYLTTLGGFVDEVRAAIALHCVPKNIPDCNLKKDYQILIIFCTDIPDTAGHQMTVQVPTLPNVCFCTTWGKRNTRNTRWNEPKTSKNIPDIIDCNSKKDYQILIVFGTYIPDITGHQMIIRVSTSPNVCFCTTCKTRTSEICVEINKKTQ